METYTFLRQLADSWVLLAMTLFFAGMILWTLRPGAKATHADIARIPLRNDELKAPCKGQCEDCGGCKAPDFEV